MLLTRLCGQRGSTRLLPFVHILIAVVVQVILYISWSFFQNSRIVVPQYLIESSVLDAFDDEGVKVMQIISASVGLVLIAEIIFEGCIYCFSSKFDTNLRESTADSNIWPSDRFLDALKDWSIRILCTLAIIVPPIVLLKIPSGPLKILYVYGMRVFRYTAVSCAASISITDTIDRSWQQYLTSFTLNIAYCISELMYYFYSIQDQSVHVVNVLTFVKAFRVTAILLICFRILGFIAIVVKYVCKTGELRLRRISIKEWRFIMYTGFLTFLSILIVAVGAQNGYDLYRTTAKNQILYYVLFMLLAMIASLFPFAVSRYEVARAQVTFKTMEPPLPTSTPFAL
jgi:hypothetical protein